MTNDRQIKAVAEAIAGKARKDYLARFSGGLHQRIWRERTDTICA